MKRCKSGLHEYPEQLKRCPTCRSISAAACYQRDSEQRKAKSAKWAADNPERAKARRKEYYLKNREHITQRNLQWKEAHAAEVKDYKAEWYKKNAKRANAEAVIRNRTRRNYDKLFKFKGNLRTLIGNSLRNLGYRKTTKTYKILGADYSTVHTHLILTALSNYKVWLETEAYDIDHIIPLSSAKSEIEVVALNHYTNLQWLYPHDNLAKSDSLTWVLPT